MTSIGEIVGTIALDDKFSGPANKFLDALGLTGASFKAVTGFAGLAAAGITAAAGAIGVMAVHGAKVAGMQSSFENLTRAIGETSSEMLGAAREGTRGLVADLDLMAASNKAMLLGLPITSESLGTMAKAATTLGRAMGQDATKSMDDLITALGRGSPMILDNLGITVKVGEANEEYARKLGKSATALTESEKKMAFYEAAMSAAEKKVAEMGETQLTFGERLQQARVGVQNFVDGLSAAITTSPVLAAGMEGIQKAIGEAFGPNQESLIQSIVKAVGNFAIFLVDAAGVGVEAVRFLSNAWDGAKSGFNAFMEVLTSAVAAGASLLADLAEKGSALPLVGEKMAGLAGGLREIQERADATSASFAEQAEEALVSAEGSNAAYDSVRATLKGVSEAMEAAASSQATMAAQGPPAAQAIAEVGAAAQLTAAQLKAIEDQTREGIEALMDTAAQARDVYAQVQEELTVMNASGVEARLLELEFARQKEIAGIQHLAFMYPEMYNSITELVTEKYRQMAAAAQGTHVSIEQAAAAQGFSTRAELEHTARVAQETYDRMRASGLFTEAALLEAKKKAEEEKRRLEAETTGHTMTSNEALRAGALQLYGVLSEKFKAVAIAGAVISTYQAVAKSMAAAPWPANLVLAAGALAAGMANVAKIRGSQAGFAEGTPGTSFVDFGRETVTALHGEEAVVNRAQGATLAEVIAARQAQAMVHMDSQSASEVRLLREEMAAERRRLPIMLRDAGLLGAV